MEKTTSKYMELVWVPKQLWLSPLSGGGRNRFLTEALLNHLSGKGIITTYSQFGANFGSMHVFI